MQVFENREDAGRQLGGRLAVHAAVQGAERLVVLGVPRGGLPVGAEVARALDAPLDVVVVRKLRSPQNPEIGFGAVGTDGYVEVDEAAVERLGITPEQVEAEIADRQAAVQRRLDVYRGVVRRAELADATVVVVDDGIATGSTARQACSFARRMGARHVVMATPVAPADIGERLADVADDLIILSSPAEFISVGQAYTEFAQLDDTIAVEALRRAGVPAG